MLNYTTLGLILVVSYVTLYLVRSLVNSYRHAANARRLGAETPHEKVNKLPFGIDHLKRLTAADNEDRIPNEIMKIFTEEGKDTFQHYFLGKRQLFTTHPRNIQAILATQFYDFEIPENRANSFWPLLGRGIFTANGQFWFVSDHTHLCAIELEPTDLLQGTFSCHAPSSVHPPAGS
jgi:hypothetical protein